MTDFVFFDKTGKMCDSWPPIRAAAVDALSKSHQMQKYGRETFGVCSGMVDYKNSGWIIRAWDVIRITFRNGVVTGRVGNDSRVTNYIDNDVGPMDYKITDGVLSDSVLHPVKIESPWSVYTEKELSLFIMPPYYHSNITNDFVIYPGINDYSPNSPSLPIILAPKREGDFVIEPGTPLYHIIPFEKNNYEIGLTTQDPWIKNKVELDPRLGPGYYRKHVMKKTKYSVKNIDNV